MEIAWLKKHEGKNSRDKTNENSFMILKRVFIVTAFAVRVFKEERESILPAVLGCVESVTTEYLSW